MIFTTNYVNGDLLFYKTLFFSWVMDEFTKEFVI